MAQGSTTSNFPNGVDVSDGTNGGLFANGTRIINADGTFDFAFDTSVTTGTALALDGNTGLTTGSLLKIASSSTAITTTGRMFLSDHTGATGTSAILNEFRSAATDETIILQVNASAALATGVALKVVGTAQTTGNLFKIASTSTALTSGALAVIDHTASGTLAARTGNSLTVSASMTHTADADVTQNFDGVAITRTVIRNTGGTDTHTTTSQGSMLTISNTITATTGTITDTTKGLTISMASGGTGNALSVTHAATGNVTAISLTTSATTVTSGVIAITGAGVTTGCAIKITLAALTTGAAIDTTGIAAAKQNFNMNASSGSTAAPQTNAPIGFFKIGIGGTDQWVPYYNAT